MSFSRVSMPSHGIGAVLRRWPTALAVVLAVLSAGGDADSVATLGQILPLLPLLYLIAAKLGRRDVIWPLLGASFALVFALRLLDVVAPSTVLVAVALIVLVWGTVDGQLRQPMFRLQVWGMIGFGALALVGLAVDPELGRYLVAAGWLLHGVWDFVHLRLDKVVLRSYAEWCGVFDVLVAAGLVLLP
jgi:hypothetical protein